MRIKHSWIGVTAFSTDLEQLALLLAPDVFGVLRCNGMALGAGIGKRVAALMVGAVNS